VSLAAPGPESTLDKMLVSSIPLPGTSDVQDLQICVVLYVQILAYPQEDMWLRVKKKYPNVCLFRIVQDYVL